jgi:hypothetical protein
MLDGMNKKFANPYVIFYPVLSRDGMPFPVNKCLKEIQGPHYRENLAWRGNLVIAKYRDEQLSALIDATMADFPLLKNYLSTHYSPMVSVSLFLLLVFTSLPPSPSFSQPFASLRRPALFGLRKVEFRVLTRFLPRPRPLTHSNPASHNINHRPRLRLKRDCDPIPLSWEGVGWSSSSMEGWSYERFCLLYSSR